MIHNMNLNVDHLSSDVIMAYPDYPSIFVDEYSQLKRAFQGGFTHASARHVGSVLENVISYDIASSYPMSMLEQLPSGSCRVIDKIKNDNELTNYLKNYCCLMDVEMWDIQGARYEHPISASKCWKGSLNDAILNNGRVHYASHLCITCTELDFDTYKKFYKIGRIQIRVFRVYEKRYLPKPIIEALAELYTKKTRLKGVPGQEINYMVSKNMINSSYGMTVMDVVRQLIEYTQSGEYKKLPNNPKEAIEKYNRDPKRFLFYPWGVWITAYSRHNLLTAIKTLGPDYVYSDTDSVKFINNESGGREADEFFYTYNEWTKHKVKSLCEYMEMPLDSFEPVDRKGKAHHIGLWELDGQYKRFKTLGAKRYMYEDDTGIHITVAGLNKKSGAEFFRFFPDPFKAFTNHTMVPPSHSGRLVATYIDDAKTAIVQDYLGQSKIVSEASAIHLEPTSYDMGLTSEYISYLKGEWDVSW